MDKVKINVSGCEDIYVFEPTQLSRDVFPVVTGLAHGPVRLLRRAGFERRSSPATIMTSLQQGLIREGPSGLPPDWGDWVGEERLAGLVERAVDALLGTGRGRVAASPESLCSAARLALRWLVYAYARGIYFSRDLEFFRSSQGDIGKPFSAAAPDPSLLRLIRRQYREFIELALAKVAECVWREARADGRLGLEYGGSSYLESALDRWNPELGETDFKREGVARVSRAVRADSMALDE